VTLYGPRAVFEAWLEAYGPPAGELGPERYVREVLGAVPDPFQLAVLRAYGRGVRQISIESCHGPGKTCVIAWLIVLQLTTRYPQKVAATAPTSGQMEDALLAEVKKWMQRLPPPILALYNIKSDRIELKAAPTESFATFRTARPETPEALQGVHCDPGYVLLVADEGDGVPGAIFEAGLGSMSQRNATTILAGNPYRTSGFFYNANHGEGAGSWYRLHVTAHAGEHCGAIEPDGQGTYISERVDPQFARMIAEEYGEDSNVYRVRVLGRPPRSEADVIIPLELIEAARGRNVQPSPTAQIVWGVDPGLSHDLATLAKRKANVLTEPIKTWSGLRDSMLLVGVIKAEWDLCQPSERPIAIYVDAIGIGKGTADRLIELGLPAVAINVSETPALNSERYKNVRTELCFAARDWFYARDCAIPHDPKFEQEAAAQKYKPLLSSGLVLALPKADMMKYIHPRRSPDRLDAFLLTFAGGATAAMGFTHTAWGKPLKRDVKGIV
jgi:hypothetical protein